MHAVEWFQVLLCIANNSIKHKSFVHTLLNDQKVLFQTIQFSMSHLFLLSLNMFVYKDDFGIKKPTMVDMP